MLNERKRFKCKDYSVPKDDPIHNCDSDKELYEAIERQISPCECVIIMAGVYSTYSKWINKEIEIAKNLGKTIIAVEPWGSERTSQIVTENADKVVKWNTESIVDAIRYPRKGS